MFRTRFFRLYGMFNRDIWKIFVTVCLIGTVHLFFRGQTFQIVWYVTIGTFQNSVSSWVITSHFKSFWVILSCSQVILRYTKSFWMQKPTKYSTFLKKILNSTFNRNSTFNPFVWLFWDCMVHLIGLFLNFSEQYV